MSEQWESKTFIDAIGADALFCDGDWIESKDQDPNGEVRLVQLADILDGEFKQKSERFMTRAKSNELRTTLLEKGDLLIARMPDPIGRACIFPGSEQDCVTVVDVAIARPTNCDPEWLMHCLNSQSLRTAIEERATGSTRKRISRSALSEMTLPVPPLPEQKKIAEILSGIDKAITLKQKAVENLKSTREAVCNELILMSAGNHEEPVGSVTTHMTNGFVGTATPYYRKQGVRYLTSKNIRSDRIDPRNMVFVSDEFHASNQKSALKSGDVLMVQSGHIGTTAVVPEEYTDCNCHALILMRFESEKIDPHFASVYFNSTEGKRRLSDIFVGSTIKHVNTGDLKKFRIPVPSMEIQKDIAAKMKAMDTLLEVKQHEINKQIALKKAISMNLLSGRKRVSV
jgi:type I restriction enzyme S subunit